MKQQQKAYLFAGAAVLMWSTVGAAFKLTLRLMPPELMLLIASMVSVFVLAIIILIQGKWKLFLWQYKKDLLKSALLGLINPFLFYLVLFNAYDMLLTQEAMVLNFTWPVTLSLLSIPFLKQRIGWKGWAPVFISFTGIVIIGTNGHVLSLNFSNPLGVGLALGSTVLWSLFWIFNVRDQRDEVVKLLWNFTFGYYYILIYVLVTGIEIPAEAISTQGIGGAVYIGVFEMGVAFVLWLKALQLSRTTTQVSNLIFLAPFISLVIISVMVGESILISTFAGLVFIIAGIGLQRYLNRD